MMWSAEEFTGLRCLVTGAAIGIGLAICQAFYQDGADVTAVDVAAAPLYNAPWSRSIACNITVEHDLVGLANSLSEEPVLEVLVNAAGIMRKYPIGDTDWVEWDRLYAVNCRGALQFTELVLNQLLNSTRGRIVNVASMTAALGLPTYAPYSSAKAALLNATKVLGAELAHTDITVNTIAPGWVATPMMEPLFTQMEQLHQLPTGEGRGYIGGLIPQHRLVEPYEVAAATLFLASRAGGAITGHDLAIDGGLSTMFTPGIHTG